MKGDEMANYSGYTTEDNSGDRKYFVLIPQLIWALSRNVYDLTFWIVVKMIAGESGECFLTVKQMAVAAMMGEEKVKDCREYLMKCGVLDGKIQRDPTDTQAVWHLRIPNTWKENIEWREANPRLLDRIQQKAEHTDRLHVLSKKGWKPDRKVWKVGSL